MATKKTSRLGHDPMDWVGPGSNAQDKAPSAKQQDVAPTDEATSAPRPGNGDNSSNADAEHKVVALPAQLRIVVVDEVRQTLLDALAAQQLCIQAGAVDDVDAAGIQVLLAAAKQAAKDGQRWQLQDCSAVLARGFARAGVKDLSDWFDQTHG